MTLRLSLPAGGGWGTHKPRLTDHMLAQSPIRPFAATRGTAPAATQRPLRALHLFATLNRGGAETWLMDIVRNSSRKRMAIDACVTQAERGAYEQEFESLGGRVHRCLLGRNPWRFMSNFERLLDDESYDVVHSHLYYFSGFALRAAARAGVPQRIAHNHPAEDIKARSILRPLYAAWMRRWTVHYGTDFVGPTRASMEAFWGPEWESDPHKRVIYNGVRVERFLQPVDGSAVRRELDLPAGAKIVLNVSRFVPHKRQAFLVDVALELARFCDFAYFILIGDGPLRESVERDVRSRDLSPRFRFIRGLPSIDRYWLAADVFAFPSVNEGFGIVVAEAAAAGLPVVAQDIPGVREAAVVLPAVTLLPLQTDAAAWAAVLSRTLDEPRPCEQERQALLDRFPFTIEASVESLERLYAVECDVELGSIP